MLVLAFFQWWYGPGWVDAGRRLRGAITNIYLNFSVPSLLPTMFAPWRRIISSSEGSIGEKIRAGVDNLVSRAVGFIVRLLALASAVFLIIVIVVAGGALLIIWPLLPALGPALIVGGLL